MKKEYKTAKELGLWERLSLTLAGWSDGKNGLLKSQEDGPWTSALLHLETAARDEFCAQLWRELQNELHPRYVELQAQVTRCEDKLRVWKEKREKGTPPADEGRKNGEQSLSEEQVAARRRREQEKAQAIAQSALLRAREEYQAAQSALVLAVAEIENRETAVKLRCAVAEEHTRRRITVYWKAAARRCPELPTQPPRFPMDRLAEDLYHSQHQSILEGVRRHLPPATTSTAVPIELVKEAA